jgi:hypothetical protein
LLGKAIARAAEPIEFFWQKSAASKEEPTKKSVVSKMLSETTQQAEWLVSVQVRLKQPLYFCV